MTKGKQVKFDRAWIKRVLYGSAYGAGFNPGHAAYKKIQPIFWELRVHEQFENWKQSMVDRDKQTEAELAHKEASAERLD